MKKILVPAEHAPQMVQRLLDDEGWFRAQVVSDRLDGGPGDRFVVFEVTSVRAEDVERWKIELMTGAPT